MTKVTKSNKGWRECSQKLMSLSPIFSMPIFSSTEFSILRISCGSDNVKVTSIKTHPRSFLCLCYSYINRSKVTFCQRRLLVPVYLSMCKSECEIKLLFLSSQIYKYIHKFIHSYHKYYKLFSRNNIKLGYSCMPNMNNVIRKHNSKIMKNPAPSTTKTCNCRRKTDCPMDGNCLSECLIYKASVSTTTNKYYYGTCENTFKERYNNHNSSFRNKSREKNTELPKYVWELKEKDIILLIGILL